MCGLRETPGRLAPTYITFYCSASRHVHTLGPRDSVYMDGCSQKHASGEVGFGLHCLLHDFGACPTREHQDIAGSCLDTGNGSETLLSI